MKLFESRNNRYALVFIVTAFLFLAFCIVFTGWLMTLLVVLALTIAFVICWIIIKALLWADEGQK
jgi:hypothetical protein